jgi:hypothetical protein
MLTAQGNVAIYFLYYSNKLCPDFVNVSGQKQQFSSTWKMVENGCSLVADKAYFSAIRANIALINSAC